MKKLSLLLVLFIILPLLFSCSGESVEGIGGKSVFFNAEPAKRDTVPVITEEKEEYESLVTKLSFLGCGDNIVYYGTVRDAQSKAVAGGRQYNFKPIYSDVAELISGADISFINQETLMCGDGYQFSYYPMFNGPQDMGYDLCELGFDVVGMANNHMLDKGAKGLSQTIDFWNGMPAFVIGGYHTEEDFNDIRVYEKNGIKIAFLSYTYGTNGLTAPDGSGVYIPYLLDGRGNINPEIDPQIEAAKSKADLVFVSVHWGDEGSMKPNAYQKTIAQHFADMGVDVIIGHHPHVIQPVEWLTGSDGGRTLCVYSLGNFMAEQDRDYNMVGGMISFNIVSFGGKCKIEDPVFIPTVYDFDRSFYNNHIYLLENYTAEQAANHGIIAYGRRTSLSVLRKYVSDTVSDEFLPESYKAKIAG